MAIKKSEISPSGSPIFRYEKRTKPFEVAVAPPDIEEIENHIEKYFGKIESVFHELVSDLVHIDVFYIKPTPDRNFITLIRAIAPVRQDGPVLDADHSACVGGNVLFVRDHDDGRPVL